MRNSSKVFIYIDLQKALDSGIKFYMSSNGVVLSDGDEYGYIRPRFFQVVKTASGETLTDWQPTVTSVATSETMTKEAADGVVVEKQEKTENLAL